MVTEATKSGFLESLEARGVSRRSFMKLCGSLAVAAGLSELAAPRVAKAILFGQNSSIKKQELYGYRSNRFKSRKSGCKAGRTGD